MNPIAAAFLLTTIQAKRLATTRLLDEETLTAAILGGVSVAMPLVARAFGSGSETQSKQCSWGSFNKNGQNWAEHSERSSGGDFCLVLWDSSEYARIAVFQAKKSIPPSALRPTWRVDAHRDPKEVNLNGKTYSFSQMLMLAATGVRLATKESARKSQLETAADLKASGSNERRRALEACHWVHYLAYGDGDPVCRALADVPDKVIEHEFDAKPGQAPFDVKSDWTSFYDLIRCGVDVQAPAYGWLRIERRDVELVLPELVDLMSVYEGDGDGGAALVLDQTFGIGDSREYVNAPESQPDQVAELDALLGQLAPSSSNSFKM